ncbi:hypothetical protein [Hugenholtzia roseola]|uniref:hypothetical protein n=1 Tax=Hugenholtzia roseola TaxID=1002 RepID=UPI00047AD9A7|nr:hypothetical protein [Hugenholtzia roseola]
MKIVKYFWIFSMVAFMATLLYCYVSYDTPIFVFKESPEALPYALEKSNFFYAGLGAILTSNILTLLLSNLLPRLRPPFLPLPAASFWAQNSYTRQRMTEYLEGWTKGIGIFLNLILILAVLHIITLNDAAFSVETQNWLFGIFALLLFWIGLFFYLFIGTKKEIAEMIEIK